MKAALCRRSRDLLIHALALVFAVIPAISIAAQDKALYDLQEMCGKRAEELYINEFAEEPLTDQSGQEDQGDQGGPGLFPYVNHYNIKRNKCFMLVTSKAVSDDNKVLAISVELIDVNEHRMYGAYASQADASVGECFVQDQQCGSLAEWKKLITPFMEE